MSFASGSGEGNQGQQGQNEDYMAIGNTKNPKNVIFMVGDGMGPAYNSDIVTMPTIQILKN